MPLWSALVVSLSLQRVPLAEETADRGGSVVAAFLEDLDQIPPGQDHDRVAVFADLLVGLGVDVGRCDQDAELAVPQPRDEAAGPPDADAVRGLGAKMPRTRGRLMLRLRRRERPVNTNAAECPTNVCGPGA